MLHQLLAAALLGPWAASSLRVGTHAKPEPHASCGGNYGWMHSETPWAGKPCPPPQWEPAWPLNLSTTPFTPWGPEVAAGNIPGFVDAVNASRFGWMTFDWSDANAVRSTHFNTDTPKAVTSNAPTVV